MRRPRATPYPSPPLYPSFPFFRAPACPRAAPERRLSMPVLLLELPSQPLRGGLAATTATTATATAAVGLRVAATVLALGDDALNLLLPSFCRRHLRRVLLPPLCPPVLEPHLKIRNRMLALKVKFAILIAIIKLHNILICLFFEIITYQISLA